MYSHYEKIAKEAMFNNHDITKEIVEAFYRFKQKEYRTEDVKMHADDLYNEGQLTYSEFVYVNDFASNLAERYLTKYQDCSLAENDVFRAMILNYVRDNKDFIPYVEEEA